MITHDVKAGIRLIIKGKQLNLDGTNRLEEVKRIRREEKVNDGTELLLLFLWVLDEELRMLTMHPESLSCDLTHGSNKSKKELNIVAFKDGNNNVYPAAHAFQPNARRVIFSLFFRDGLVNLWPRTVIERNCFFIMDGDQDMYMPFVDAARDKVYPNSTLGRCQFHLHYTSWRDKVDARKMENWEPSLMKAYRWIESWMIPGKSKFFYHK